MATLQKIRNRGGILVAIIIGLALVAFILGDMLQSGSSLMRPGQMEIAEIAGESIQYPEFQKKVEELVEIYKMNTRQSQVDEKTLVQLREQTWQKFLHQIIMDQVNEEVGLGVSSDELFELIQGNDPHPIIKQLFADPNTGAVNKSAILQFLKALEGNVTPEQKAYWLFIEDEIKQGRMEDKYNNLINKGLYVTNYQAQKSLEEKNHKVGFQYIALQYAKVPDSVISVSDKDLKNYYEAHKNDYKQETKRTVEYVAFNVVPSEADDAATLKWVKESKEEFAATENNEQYINVNSDVRFEDSFKKQEELSLIISDWAFSASEGDVFGPYKEDNSYKLSKVDKIDMLPDSVMASHILITPDKAGSLEKAQATIDSLKNLIEKGASFSELAKEFSEDPGSGSKGGDLGWFKRNMMVKPFEEAAFNGDINKLYTVQTRFGVHLIKPTKKGKEVKQVRMATLVRNIVPSTQTYQDVYAQASKFAGENQTGEAFQKAVIDEMLDKKLATLNEEDREIAGLESPRTLVRAAYDAEEGDILINHEGSPIFELGDKFVIATLTKATEEGIMPFEDVKARIELVVQKEKKAEFLADKIKVAADNETDMEVISGKLDTESKEFNTVNFGVYSIPEIGAEPALVGTVTSLPQDVISNPIKGEKAVFLVKVTSITDDEIKDITSEKDQLVMAQGYRIKSQTFKVLQEAAGVTDKRSKFY